MGKKVTIKRTTPPMRTKLRDALRAEVKEEKADMERWNKRMELEDAERKRTSS